VPGYARYHTLANRLVHARDPLDYISNAEDCYYGIIETLRERVVKKAETKICEVGCGQGYLTYALVRGGFNCTGVDISKNAVALAKQRFGDNYFCGDVNDFIATYGKPRVIVAAELIEHLPNPLQFISDMLSALGEEGFVVVTTPNKVRHVGVIWDTELPPVHLWWFTKRSLTAIARQLSCNIDFVDFTPFYRKNPLPRQIRTGARLPIFNEQYELIQFSPKERKLGRLRRQLREILPRSITEKIQRLRAGGEHRRVDDANSSIIAAIFSKHP
jgi:SAM-dependent methyltransferase